MFRLATQSDLVHVDGLANVATTLVGQTFVVKVDRIVGLDGDGVRIVLQRLPVLTELKSGVAAVEVYGRILRLRLQGRGEVLYRLLVLTWRATRCCNVVACEPSVVVVPRASIVLDRRGEELLRLREILLLGVREA